MWAKLGQISRGDPQRRNLHPTRLEFRTPNAVAFSDTPTSGSHWHAVQHRGQSNGGASAPSPHKSTRPKSSATPRFSSVHLRCHSSHPNNLTTERLLLTPRGQPKPPHLSIQPLHHIMRTPLTRKPCAVDGANSAPRPNAPFMPGTTPSRGSPRTRASAVPSVPSVGALQSHNALRAARSNPLLAYRVPQRQTPRDLTSHSHPGDTVPRHWSAPHNRAVGRRPTTTVAPPSKGSPRPFRSSRSTRN